MARLVDVDRRVSLLDDVVRYLAEHGLANVSLRPLADSLGVSVNALVHHFGSKDDLIVAALRRSERVQQAIEDRWLERNPGMSQADLLRAWWRWITASSHNLAIVRLGIEAAALDATVTGLPRRVRGDQIGLWRQQIETRLVREGVPPEVATVEASLAKAMFTGLVVDLMATGQKARLTRALEVGLARLEQVIWSSAGLQDPQVPPSARHRGPLTPRPRANRVAAVRPDRYGGRVDAIVLREPEQVVAALEHPSLAPPRVDGPGRHARAARRDGALQPCRRSTAQRRAAVAGAIEQLDVARAATVAAERTAALLGADRLDVLTSIACRVPTETLAVLLGVDDGVDGSRRPGPRRRGDRARHRPGRTRHARRRRRHRPAPAAARRPRRSDGCRWPRSSTRASMPRCG